MNIVYPMIGKHPASLVVLQNISKAAQMNAPVLITGETGTGKELIANAIQQQSRRRNDPYMRINCAALCPALIESDLFGYRKGIFTDTDEDKPGLFEEVGGGTLLLDEIEFLPLIIQAKLLRFIEQGAYQPCGELDYKNADVRLLMATNVNLKQRVEQGLFSQDLYSRLNAFQLRVPALRDRKTDIPMLIGYYLGSMSKHYAAPCPQLAHETLDALIDYAWPGNIRELRNVCENLVVRRLTGKVLPQQLPLNLDITSVAFPFELLPLPTKRSNRPTLQSVLVS